MFEKHKLGCLYILICLLLDKEFSREFMFCKNTCRIMVLELYNISVMNNVLLFSYLILATSRSKSNPSGGGYNAPPLIRLYLT